MTFDEILAEAEAGRESHDFRDTSALFVGGSLTNGGDINGGRCGGASGGAGRRSGGGIHCRTPVRRGRSPGYVNHVVVGFGGGPALTDGCVGGHGDQGDLVGLPVGGRDEIGIDVLVDLVLEDAVHERRVAQDAVGVLLHRPRAARVFAEAHAGDALIAFDGHGLDDAEQVIHVVIEEQRHVLLPHADAHRTLGVGQHFGAPPRLGRAPPS